METCILTWVFLFIGVCSILGDTYVYGGGLNLLGSALYVILIAIINNFACNSEYFGWVAWLIVVIHFITLIFMIYLLTTKTKEEIKTIIG